MYNIETMKYLIYILYNKITFLIKLPTTYVGSLR